MYRRSEERLYTHLHPSPFKFHTSLGNKKSGYIDKDVVKTVKVYGFTGSLLVPFTVY